MATTTKATKDIVDYLKRAKAATEEEQDRYRVIIDNSMKPGAAKELNKQILAGGWKSILLTMQDCCHPPTHQERQKTLNIEWAQELKHTKLNKISDEDIRHRTYFLNETIEHTQRLRSMAMFIERIGPLKDFGELLFCFWGKRSSLMILQDEAVLMGKEAEAESARKLCKAIDGITDIFIDFEMTEGASQSLTRERLNEILKNLPEE
ncbi:MAG: hypothetical protein HGA96_02635 [Desulfobulbaceae bacterium]|nr:hypothetical protein [Desulfobulbaceae bacterium]